MCARSAYITMDTLRLMALKMCYIWYSAWLSSEISRIAPRIIEFNPFKVPNISHFNSTEIHVLHFETSAYKRLISKQHAARSLMDASCLPDYLFVRLSACLHVHVVPSLSFHLNVMIFTENNYLVSRKNFISCNAFGQMSAIWWPKNCWNWWCPTIV